jgi:acetylornithine deacetylase/succinyl-diaminopimelate desuccinylase-like protein
MSAEREFVQDHKHELLSDLDEWLRIPGISALPEHHADVLASAEWFMEACKKAGFPTVELWETPGLPTVYAEWLSADKDAPVVLVYGHHDVQPVDPTELWQTDPFDPTVDGDVLRARGASDDKGQLLFHLLGLRAHLAATGRTTPQVTIKLLIEGEEESGSPNFEATLKEHRDQLNCDVVVITDTGMIAADIPSTVTGMRGMVLATVDFHGPDLDLHSGMFGGAVANPATAIARLVGALHDEHGHVQVPGFYDDVLELTDQERALFARVPDDEQEFLRVAKSRALAGEQGFSTLERLGARPTAEVNGIWGGYMGAGGKTIVPSDALAKLSFRLVANQQPAKVQQQVTAFIHDNTPEGIEATIEWEGVGVEACLVPFDGRDVLPTREGGSGPEAAIQSVLGAPLVFLGVGLPDDQIHAPNEKVTLSMLYRGAEAAALLWKGLAEVGKQGLGGQH